MRMTLRALPLLAVLLFPGSATAQTPCARDGYRRVARNPQAVVLVKRDQHGIKAACFLRHDKLRYLANTQDDWVSHVTLSGHFVAYYDHFIDGAADNAEAAALRVLDIKRRATVFDDRTTSYQ